VPLRALRLPLLGAFLLLAVVSLLSAKAAPAQEGSVTGGPYERLVIRGATLIDGTGSPPVGPVDIVVEGGRITDVRRVTALDLARGTERAAGDRVIDAEGKWVMPGIIDAHTHMGHGGELPANYIPKLWLGHGVTTVRTFVGSEDDPAVALSAAQERGEATVAPRVRLSRFWRGDDPRLWSAEDAPQVVAEWREQGYEGVKISGKPGLLPDVLRAIAEATREQEMGLAVHIGQDGVVPMDAVAVASAGASTIEHHYGYAESTFEDRTVQDLTADYDYGDELDRFRATARVWDEAEMDRLHGSVTDTLLALSREGRFTMVPTFSVYEDQTDLARARNLPWIEDYAHPAMVEGWTPSRETHGSFYFEWTSRDEAAWGRMFLKWLPWVNEFKNRGGHAALGSDAGTFYHLYGFGTIREMELMERAGFHPLEVVRSATMESARAVGLEGETGVVRVGHEADLLVLDHNPLDDLKVLYGHGALRTDPEGGARRIHGLRYTISDGRVFDARSQLEDVREMVEEAGR